MSIASARAEIRWRRKVTPTSTGWRILSTDGGEHRVIEWNPDGTDLTCSCPAGQSQRYCWHRRRIQEYLRAKHGGAAPMAVKYEPPPVALEPEPAIGSMSWRQIFDAAASTKRQSGRS